MAMRPRKNLNSDDDESYLGYYSSLALPDEPTGASPGSEAKIRVMRTRAESGRAIFHPLDASCCRIPEGEKGGGECEIGVTLRQRNTAVDWVVSLVLGGVRIWKCFPADQYERAAAYARKTRDDYYDGVLQTRLDTNYVNPSWHYDLDD